MATCSINNCISCMNSVCSNCFPGYSLSADMHSCNPICNDFYCTNCLTPGVCGTCLNPYTPDVNGKCSISNCST